MTGRLLDRDAVRTVLRRATELSDDQTDALSGLDGVDEEALVAAAAEVGIPADAVRRALAVERLEPPPKPHAADRLVGAAVVAVDGEVAGSAPEVLARLDEWFVEGHHLRRDRLGHGRGEWSRRTGIIGSAVRMVRVATGEGRLGLESRVRASTADTGTGTTVVRVEVDRSHARRSAAAGAAVATVATAGSLVLAAIAGPVLVAAAPIGVAAGVGVAATGRARASTVAREVDRVIDAVGGRVAPTRLRADLARRVIGVARRTDAPAASAPARVDIAVGGHR